MQKYRVFYEVIGESFNRITYVSAYDELHAKQEAVRTLLDFDAYRGGYRTLSWVEAVE